MEFERNPWYRLIVLVISAACTVYLLDAVHARWPSSFLGVLLFVLCLSGIERGLKTTIAVLVILLRPRRH